MKRPARDAAPPPADIPPAPPPVTNDDELTALVNTNLARLMTLCTEPKQLTDALKVAVEWRETRYGAGHTEALGRGYAPGGTGHGG